MSARNGAKRRPPMPLPLLLTELALSSWETIAHRTVMMAFGSCSGAEYQRMFWEKVTAAQLSSLALLAPASAETMNQMLKPWHRRATANARRLRRK